MNAFTTWIRNRTWLTTHTHLTTHTLLILKKQQHTFSFNFAKEFRDLPASVTQKCLTPWVGHRPEITISTTPGPNLAVSQADLELRNLPVFVTLYLSEKLAR